MATVAERTLPPGRDECDWDLRDDRGTLVAPGLYLLRLQVEGRLHLARVVVAR